MYTIQTNASGTRSMEISEEHLKTIEKYALFQQLIDSNGIVDESVLDKLKLNVRSLIAAQTENCKDLLDLCIDVIDSALYQVGKRKGGGRRERGRKRRRINTGKSLFKFYTDLLLKGFLVCRLLHIGLENLKKKVC